MIISNVTLSTSTLVLLEQDPTSLLHLSWKALIKLISIHSSSSARARFYTLPVMRSPPLPSPDPPNLPRHARPSRPPSALIIGSASRPRWLANHIRTLKIDRLDRPPRMIRSRALVVALIARLKGSRAVISIASDVVRSSGARESGFHNAVVLEVFEDCDVSMECSGFDSS